jgi:hypothetical protein
MQLPSYTSIPCMYGSGGVADNVSSSLKKWFWWSVLAGAKDPNSPTLRSGLSATCTSVNITTIIYIKLLVLREVCLFRLTYCLHGLLLLCLFEWLNGNEIFNFPESDEPLSCFFNIKHGCWCFSKKFMKMWCVLVITFFTFSRFNYLLQEMLYSLVWSVFFIQTYGGWVSEAAFIFRVHFYYRMYYDILYL